MKRSAESDGDENSEQRFEKRPKALANEQVLDEEFAEKLDCEFVLEDISVTNSTNFVFMHMIHQVLSLNKSIVDEEITYLRKDRRSVKMLHCSDLLASAHKDSAADVSAIISTPKMIKTIEETMTSNTDDAVMQSALQKFRILLLDSDLVSVSHQTLLGKVREECLQVSGTTFPIFDEEEIERLMFACFLRRRLANQGSGDSFYWISHPQLFQVAKSLRDLELRIMTAIRRTKYKELSAKQAMKVFSGFQNRGEASTHSPSFQWKYHLLDLTGRNLVKKVDIPGNSSDHYILRLRSD